MKTIRVFLIASPLVYLFAIRVQNAQLGRVDGLITLLLVAAIAAVAALYARHNDRSAFLWTLVSILVPIPGPVILACLPAKKTPPAHGPGVIVIRKELGDAPEYLGLPTTFAEKLPLVARCISEAPQASRAALLQRFESVRANLEFAIRVDKGEAPGLVRQIEALKITGCAVPDHNHVYLFGAGEVKEDRMPDLIDGLRRFSLPGSPMTLARHGANGSVSMSEYNH